MGHRSNDVQKDYKNAYPSSFHASKTKAISSLRNISLVVSDILIMLVPLFLLLGGIGLAVPYLCGGYGYQSHCSPMVTSMPVWFFIAAGVALFVGILIKVICHFIVSKK